MLKRLKNWIEDVKKDIAVLLIASKDDRTPLPAQIMSSFVLGYVVSPIDIIPDFIPIIGLLDDVLIVAMGISFVVKRLSPELLAEYREKAKKITEIPKSNTGTIIILATWIVFTVLLAKWFFSK